MNKHKQENFNKREELALEVLKIILPSLNKKPLFSLDKRTFDGVVRDSYYVADAFIKESKETS